jgi:hypothetical protein
MSAKLTAYRIPLEVGDVFTHEDISGERVAKRVDGVGRIWFDKDEWVLPYGCKLVRKADPYHGITLPKPPAGYRLAKWGEEAEAALFYRQRAGHWIAWGTRLENDTKTYDMENRCHSIFAIPLDQPAQQPPKSWQFRHEPWVPKQPGTLADAPGSVKCVGVNSGIWQVVWHDDRGKVYAINQYGGCGPELAGTPSDYRFVRYLDPPPQKPISLDDVPDGRCVMLDGQYAWRAFTESNGWITQFPNGTIREVTPTDPPEITDYIAEFQ